MTRCPHCAGRLRKVGPPTRHGAFLDQLLDCAGCDWCGVESTWSYRGVDVEPAESQPAQLELELDL